ncbi:MAG: bifunctional adenosylcobinamide kinase/adenosylcobinamide-phosphate guanylyltransferase [Planctomycetota bacterium]
MGKLILILGGTRSGKSRYAVELAKQLDGKTVYLATMKCDDEEMKERIKKHKESRPESWQTVEEGQKCDEILLNLRGLCEVAVIDCLTNLIANLLEQFEEEKQVLSCVETMLKIIAESNFTVLMVSNEVGSGIVPVTPLGRKFRDIAGLTNQLAARYADEVYLMTAGIPVRIKPHTGG